MKVLLLLALLAAAAAAAAAAAVRTRRDTLTPLDAELFGDDPGPRSNRDKRLLLEHKVQIGNTVKNAVLNLIFGKINSVIDSKNALVGVFERANAAKNLALLGPGTKQPPQQSGFKALLGGVLSSSLGSSSGSSLGSGGLSGSSSGGGGGGGGDGSASLGASFGGSGPDSGTSSASSSASAGTGGATTDKIPAFDPNRVSLEIPEQLFGSSFTLVTNISQILGDVILNTARRMQRFVESFKPKFRGLFGVQSDPTAARKRATADELALAEGTAAAAEGVEEAKEARASSFRSLTGLEPFDFDFAALDKLVRSGDADSGNKTSGSSAANALDSVSPTEVKEAVSQASAILDSSLQRVRRRTA